MFARQRSQQQQAHRVVALQQVTVKVGEAFLQGLGVHGVMVKPGANEYRSPVVPYPVTGAFVLDDTRYVHCPTDGLLQVCQKWRYDHFWNPSAHTHLFLQCLRCRFRRQLAVIKTAVNPGAASEN